MSVYSVTGCFCNTSFWYSDCTHSLIRSAVRASEISEYNSGALSHLSYWRSNFISRASADLKITTLYITPTGRTMIETPYFWSTKTFNGNTLYGRKLHNIAYSTSYNDLTCGLTGPARRRTEMQVRGGQRDRRNMHVPRRVSGIAYHCWQGVYFRKRMYPTGGNCFARRLVSFQDPDVWTSSAHDHLGYER